MRVISFVWIASNAQGTTLFSKTGKIIHPRALFSPRETNKPPILLSGAIWKSSESEKNIYVAEAQRLQHKRK